MLVECQYHQYTGQALKSIRLSFSQLASCAGNRVNSPLLGYHPATLMAHQHTWQSSRWAGLCYNTQLNNESDLVKTPQNMFWSGLGFYPRVCGLEALLTRYLALHIRWTTDLYWPKWQAPY